jgi:hypothetical protein
LTLRDGTLRALWYYFVSRAEIGTREAGMHRPCRRRASLSSRGL